MSIPKNPKLLPRAKTMRRNIKKRGEIGATMKPGENSPWSLDLNVSGFAGKKQGFTGGVSVAFMV